MKIPIISKALCPKCLTRNSVRVGSAEGVSVWLCTPCGHQFPVKIIKMKKQG